MIVSLPGIDIGIRLCHHVWNACGVWISVGSGDLGLRGRRQRRHRGTRSSTRLGAAEQRAEFAWRRTCPRTCLRAARRWGHACRGPIAPTWLGGPLGLPGGPWGAVEGPLPPRGTVGGPRATLGDVWAPLGDLVGARNERIDESQSLLAAKVFKWPRMR